MQTHYNLVEREAYETYLGGPARPCERIPDRQVQRRVDTGRPSLGGPVPGTRRERVIDALEVIADRRGVAIGAVALAWPAPSPQRSLPSRALRLRVDPTAPLWVGKSEPVDDHWSPAAQAAYQRAVSLYDRVGEVEWWQLNQGDEDLVLVGQNVVLVNNPSGRDEPVGQAKVLAPAKVVRVVPGRGRHLPVAILVREAGLATVRFSQGVRRLSSPVSSLIGRGSSAARPPRTCIGGGRERR